MDDGVSSTIGDEKVWLIEQLGTSRSSGIAGPLWRQV
jgi:hypothetical protein